MPGRPEEEEELEKQGNAQVAEESQDLLQPANAQAYMWRIIRESQNGPARAQFDVNPLEEPTHTAMDQGTFTKTLILMLLDYYLEERYVRKQQEVKADVIILAFLAALRMTMQVRHRKMTEDDSEDETFYAEKLKQQMDRIKKVYHVVVSEIEGNESLGLIAGDDDKKVSIVDKVYNKLGAAEREVLEQDSRDAVTSIQVSHVSKPA